MMITPSATVAGHRITKTLGQDVLADVAGPNRVAPDQAQGPRNPVTRDGRRRSDHHRSISLYGSD